MLSVVLIIQLMALLLSLVLGTLLVEEIHTLGLGKAVDLGAGEAGEELLGELVGDGLAVSALLVLEGWGGGLALWDLCDGGKGGGVTLEASEGGGTGDGLVGELGLVGGVVVGVVGLLVVVVGVAWGVLEGGFLEVRG